MVIKFPQENVSRETIWCNLKNVSRETMTRYKIIIEYDGTNFVGWQHQANGLSVQESIERAIHAFCGEQVTLHCAGRTDSGVHALGQVAHFDITQSHPPHQIRGAINFHLRPLPIVILAVDKVDEEFHARFSALERSYIYKIMNRPAPLTIDKNHAWHIPQNLDVDAMNEAAQILVGKHDFTSFRASHCQSSSPVKTLLQLEVIRKNVSRETFLDAENQIEIFARARSFLHHQVRNIVGTLKLVGEGKWTAADVEKALKARDRKAAGPTAPPDGLYFLHIKY